MKLAGKVAIVTGGGQGIGQGIVRCLAEEGADVAIVDINGDTATKVAAEVRAVGRKSLVILADATDSKQVTPAVQKTIDTFGKIDILVNNVGGLSKTLLARTSMEFIDQEEAEWDESYQLNLKPHVLVSRAVTPYLIKQKSGKIVNISSISGKTHNPQNMAYGANKASVIHFTRALAAALAGDNINVNCVCPGVICTPLWGKSVALSIRLRPEARGMTPEEYYDEFVAPGVPLKRALTPEDIGRAVVFLVSQDARNITGQSLNVDGGMVMR